MRKLSFMGTEIILDCGMPHLYELHRHVAPRTRALQKPRLSRFFSIGSVNVFGERDVHHSGRKSGW